MFAELPQLYDAPPVRLKVMLLNEFVNAHDVHSGNAVSAPDPPMVMLEVFELLAMAPEPTWVMLPLMVRV